MRTRRRGNADEIGVQEAPTVEAKTEVLAETAESLPTEADVERVRAIKQGVLADVSCVLACANGAEINARQAFSAARNLCEILFAHPQRSHTEIPKMFWESPLGRAIGICCGDRIDASGPRVKTTIHLPQSVSEKLRLEAELCSKSVDDLITEKLTR